MTDTMIVTHGMGDWYLPLTCARGWGVKRILVDSVYFADPHPRYDYERKMARLLLDSVGIPWEPIHPMYYGSGDFFGIPDRYEGPQYENIKNDFLFYRGQALKDHMSQYKQLICGCGIWSYYWDGHENKKLSFAKREIPVFRGNMVPLDITCLVHVRMRGFGIGPTYYQDLVDILVRHGLHPVLIGNPHECPRPNNCLDMRGLLEPEALMQAIQVAPYYIGNNSMYTWHRFGSCDNLPAISCVSESNGRRSNYYHAPDLSNPNFTIIDSDEQHLDKIEATVSTWRTR